MIDLSLKRFAATSLALCAFVVPGASSPTTLLVDDDEEEEAEGEDVDEDDSSAKWLVVVGGDVHTGTGEVLRGATLLAKNGVIKDIGYDLWIPEDAEVIDAHGLRVYPGLIAMNASSRVAEGSSPFWEEWFPEDIHSLLDGEAQSHVEEDEQHNWDYVDAGELLTDLDDRTSAASGLGDSFDPFSYQLVLTLASGITTIGQSKATYKLKRREIEGVVMREKNLQAFSYSLSNPRNIAGMRENFAKAAEYLRDYREWEELKKKDDDLTEPSRKGVDTSTLAVLRGEVRARFSANDREDLLGIARLAQEFSFRPVIFGCREGWVVAGELGRAGASAVLTPRDRDERDERVVRAGGSSIENAAILHEHGVQIAVIPSDTSINLGGIAGRDLMHLPIEAAFAIRGGLPELAALQAITVVPARMLGVEHRVGTLAPGKDCDLIVTDGDILHYETFVQYTVVEGKLVYDKQEELFFAHIRPRPVRAVPEPEVPESVEEVTDEITEDVAAEEDDEEPDDGEGEEDEGDEEGEE